MTQTASQLWSRRKSSRAHEIPMLSPLYSTALIPTSAYPIDSVPTPPSRPLPSSPALYTPTEAVGILLGQSPLEAAQSTRLAVDSLRAKMPFASPGSVRHSYYCHSSPCSPFLDRLHLSDSTTTQEASDYITDAFSNLRDDLNFDIDTAALATEVALQVLSSADCFGEPEEPNETRKIQLLQPWHQSIASATGIYLSECHSNVTEGEVLEKPIRKGRARMSQEKRKRLARRKEREAMLPGIPSKPVSAPPNMTHFPSQVPNQLNRNIPGWKQNRHNWPHDVKRPSNVSLNRSTSISNESTSRSSSASAPSLDTDDGSTSSSFSGLTSPTCSRIESRQDAFADHSRISWDVEDQVTHVPRFSLQPPSPQQCRSSGSHQLPPVHFGPSSTSTSTAQTSMATPTMRWSTTQGLMTSQGVPVAGPRAEIFWPQIFSNMDLQSSTNP